MDILERIKQECYNREIPISRLEKACGFSNGYIRNLKKGTMPITKVKKVADFFGVTPDYFVRGEGEMEQYANAVSNEAIQAMKDNPLMVDVILSFKDITRDQLFRLIGYYDAMRSMT